MHMGIFNFSCIGGIQDYASRRSSIYPMEWILANMQEIFLKIYYENRGRKTAGYVGNINQLVDMDLLEYGIINCPQVDFVLIGRIDRETTKGFRKIINQYKNCQCTLANADY